MDFQPLSPDEMQRTMQFLLNNAAKVDARLDRITEQTERISDALIGLTGIVGRLAEAQAHTDLQLKETNKRLENSESRLSADIREFESQLNEAFERRLRDDHGHRPS